MPSQEMLLLSEHPQFTKAKTQLLGHRLGWGDRPALLLVDVCVAYWKAGSPLNLSHNEAGAASPDSMRRLLEAARKGDIPVLWAQVRYNHPQMLDGAVQAKKTKTILAWQDGDPRGLDAAMPGLEPDPADIVFLKRNPSAFFGTALVGELVRLGVDTLVICGVSTSGCVRATAQDAICYGFRPMVSMAPDVCLVTRTGTDELFRHLQIVGEACGDRSDLIQQQTLFDLDCTVGDVVSEHEAVERMQAGW
jgi:nicotinamidase-related amidase